MTLINAPFQNGGVYCNGIYDIDNPATGCRVMTPSPLNGFNPTSFEISMDFMLTASSNQFSYPTPIFIGGYGYRWVGYCQYYEGGIHKFSLMTNNGNYTNTQAIIQRNQWNNAKITYNGTTVRAFLNGQLICSKNVVLVMGGSYDISCTNYGNASVFKGYLKNLNVCEAYGASGNETFFDATEAETNTLGIAGTKGTEEISKQEILPVNKLVAYPNPVTGILTVESSSSEEETYTINLINVSGQVILNQRIDAIGGKFEIDMSDVIPGPYVLEIITNKSVDFMRVVKE
jgi:hypothetical protein